MINTPSVPSLLYVAYRDWAIAARESLRLKPPLLTSTVALHEALARLSGPAHVFFVGWSEIIPSRVLEAHTCVCLHPSQLPLFRGGSPVQNQILAGVTDSAVTLFRMNKVLDGGPIYASEYLSLAGSLDAILQRISSVSAVLMNRYIGELLEGSTPAFREQDHALATSFRRRKPADSEITRDELLSRPARYLYDKIRCLASPYPNAYFTCADGSKLYLKEATVDEDPDAP